MFRVMTMIGQVSGLWPQDGDHILAPPVTLTDEEITWTNTVTLETRTTRLTGIVDHTVVPEHTGCVKYFMVGGSCHKQGTIVPYRALRYAALTFTTNTKSQYATAATATLTPVQATPEKIRDAFDTANNWSRSKSVLPKWP
jgi:hypothetical protein